MKAYQVWVDKKKKRQTQRREFPEKKYNIMISADVVIDIRHGELQASQTGRLFTWSGKEDKSMNPKQKRFCEEYLVDCNAKQAALRAGYSLGTAVRASDWINEAGKDGKHSKFRPELKEYIEKRMAEKDSELIAKQDEVLKYLTSVLRGESRSSELVVEMAGGGFSEAKEVAKAPSEKDRLKAAELLGKRYGLYTDKVESEIDMELNISVDYGDTPEE